MWNNTLPFVNNTATLFSNTGEPFYVLLGVALFGSLCALIIPTIWFTRDRQLYISEQNTPLCPIWLRNFPFVPLPKNMGKKEQLEE